MRKVKTRKSIKKDDYEDLVYYKLKSSRFKQQRLPAWRPVPTLITIIIFYLLFAIIFISIGIVLLIYSGKVSKLEISYNEICKDSPICNISTLINEDMEPPIMIYYKLDGFYQNHRRYVKSKSQKQLFGEKTTLKEMENDGECGPLYSNEDIGLTNGSLSVDNNLLDLNEVAIPCGIMAKTFFNDKFIEWKIIKDDNETSFTPNEKDIAWSKDKKLFKNSNLSKQWIDMEDEHFIVWMRPAGLPDFTKLWGRIEDISLKKGETISFKVINNYNVTHFGGDKSIILSTTTVFGGKNIFLGTSFIVVGSISLLLGIAFPLLIYQRNKNENVKKNY